MVRVGAFRHHELLFHSSHCWTHNCMHAKLLQSYLTLCNRMDCSLPGSFICGILQARILDRVPMPSSRGSSQSRKWIFKSCISCIVRLVTYHPCHLGNPEYIISTDGFSVWTRTHISPKPWWALLPSGSFQWHTWRLQTYQTTVPRDMSSDQLLSKGKTTASHLCGLSVRQMSLWDYFSIQFN